MNVTDLVRHWQRLLAPFVDAFTYWGFRRFQEWLTGLVLNVEEHTITQSLVGLGRPQDWKAVEAFAEYGRWDQDGVERASPELLEQAPGRTWFGYRVWAGDDTKVHRSSKHIWGTCTFHEYTARCPNRAGTVRAHNWVLVGAVLPRPAQPAWFLPHTGRLYFRQSQLPAGGSSSASGLSGSVSWAFFDSPAWPRSAGPQTRPARSSRRPASCRGRAAARPGPSGRSG
jgi:hypothetical protein